MTTSCGIYWSNRIVLQFDALLSKKDGQAAYGHRGDEVVAARDGVSEAQNAVALESSRAAQNRISADVVVEFTVFQLTKFDVRSFDCGEHSYPNEGR